MAFPDYYAILEISETASQDEVRKAYKKKSLECHPDRIPEGPGSAEKKRLATEQFQAVADAYYTLSDDKRRESYNRLRRTQPSASADFSSSKSYFDFFNQFKQQQEEQQEQPNAENVFTNVFEEMLRPELGRQNRLPIWALTGGVAGAAIGFIVANFPGAIAGGLGGQKLGAIRDAKGKSVATVFGSLGGSEKAEVLKALATKVFSMM